jgi:hypothetical protein
MMKKVIILVALIFAFPIYCYTIKVKNDSDRGILLILKLTKGARFLESQTKAYSTNANSEAKFGTGFSCIVNYQIYYQTDKNKPIYAENNIPQNATLIYKDSFSHICVGRLFTVSKDLKVDVKQLQL